MANTGSLLTDVWYHAALVYDQSTLKLFLNAQEVGSTVLSGPVDQDPGVSVSVGSQPAGDKHFDGNIDDVRILQRAYSQAELEAIIDVEQINRAPVANNDSYDVIANQPVNVAAAIGVLSNDTDADGDSLNVILGTDVSNGALNLNDDGSFTYIPSAGFVGADAFTYSVSDGTDSSATQATVNLSVTQEVIVSDLLTHLEFEDFQTGLIAADSSSNGNFGAIFGAEYISETGDGSGYSIEFSGNDSIDLGNIDVAGTGLTLASWINADTFPGNSRDPRIISKASGNAASAHLFMLSTIRLGTETVLRARIRVGGSTTTLIADSGTTLTTNSWHHVAVTYNGSEILLYLDGVEVGSRTLSGDIDQDNSVSVAVGSQPGGSNGFDGKIDDVRILQRALTSEEVNEIVNAAPDNDDETPAAPENLIAQAISDSEVVLTWTDVAGADEYLVYRDGVLIATVSDPTYIDATVAAGVNYSYEVFAANADGTSGSAETFALNFASARGNWWGSAWNYRSLVIIDSNGTARERGVATVPMNFDGLIARAGGEGAHDPSRVRCVEVTPNGVLLEEDIRCQSSDGELVILLPGITTANTTRYFHAYYDTANGGEQDTRTPLLTLTEDIIDEGFESIKIDNDTGSMNYHTGGAGFSSLLDTDGIDWINYNPAAGSRGVFRGIPNLVPPADGSFFHPGPSTASTTVVDSGPVRVRIESVTDDGAWRARWDVYPDFLTFTVLEKPAIDYWFLYEGTPGGELDAADSTVRSTGSESTLNGLDSWSGDIADEEWVMVNASEVPRSLFVAKRDDDDAIDSYRPASFTEGLMTILGFGRNNVDALLTETDDMFFVGFLETQDFSTARARILSTVRSFDIGATDAAVRP